MPVRAALPKKKRIVLLEDEKIVADLLTTKLERAGYEVVTAADGESGLRRIRELEPNLVLLDMLLPKLDGFSVLETLAREHRLPALPVIIISNSGQPIEVERAMKLGVRDYLIKVNFNPSDVLAKVEVVLAPSAKHPSPAGQTHARVLVIEDDPLLVELLEKKFRQEHYEIVSALNASDARRVLERGQVDLILLDLVLPGLDGLSFLKELKANDTIKHIPIIIISNLGQKEEMDLGLAAGAAAYVVKAQATPDDIVKKVSEFLATSRNSH
ncbi:response regulator [Candidatus Parcubacteria bacterium]|nr:response regulator [Candidatus Parcubacteria bacterium]